MGKYQGYQQYKDSGVQWLGNIPQHWEVIKIQYIARLKSGENITSSQIENKGLYPVFGGNGLRGYFNLYTHSGYYILIGRQGALCGNINYANGKFWASEHAVVVNPLTNFNVVWLGELLKTMDLNQYSTSAAQPGLSVEQISRLKIPLPPLEEQKAIARFLDYKTKQIDDLISKQETLITKLNEKRTALITNAVTKGLDPTVPIKDSGVQWLGNIPEHWEVKRLKHFAKICNGRDHKDVWDDNGKYPIIGSGGIFGSSNQFLHNKPSVLLGRKGTIDKPQFIDVPFWTVDTAYYTDIFDTTDSRFFYYLCLTIDFDLYKYGSAVPSMTQEKLSQIIFTNPPLEEQKAIAQYLDQKTAEIEQQKTKIQSTIEILQEYRTALITKAVTGKIDIRQIPIP
ncbi:restriction endonuclease subunit S [Anabaena sp. CS-542/02]|uniref:restriction endonuclease subunit S n=1 Tax=Anabaena sp. CS-542/02 TaxID=3021719 RepID=UPI002330A2AC|nr:restriction endonuclease subunit S [Anabaena sp. CS-542/02]MDB9445095.1 restriction endonuclease subunit S [Anabaena sp. CS-542/02]